MYWNLYLAERSDATILFDLALLPPRDGEGSVSVRVARDHVAGHIKEWAAYRYLCALIMSNPIFDSLHRYEVGLLLKRNGRQTGDFGLWTF